MMMRVDTRQKYSNFDDSYEHISWRSFESISKQFRKYDIGLVFVNID